MFFFSLSSWLYYLCHLVSGARRYTFIYLPYRYSEHVYKIYIYSFYIHYHYYSSEAAPAFTFFPRSCLAPSLWIPVNFHVYSPGFASNFRSTSRSLVQAKGSDWLPQVFQSLPKVVRASLRWREFREACKLRQVTAELRWAMVQFEQTQNRESSAFIPERTCRDCRWKFSLVQVIALDFLKLLVSSCRFTHARLTLFQGGLLCDFKNISW